MVHIFIHHAEDAQGHVLAALIKHCDSQTHRNFQFLVVDGEDSIRRMQQFLQQQGLSQKVVHLPFIVLVRSEGNMVHRSVLHGSAMHQWLAEMVDAFLETPGITPARVKQTFLDPFLSPHVWRLVHYALATSTTPPCTENVVAQAEAMSQPPSQTTKLTPAYIEEMPEEEEEMLVDGYVAMSYATSPVPNRGSNSKSRREGVVNGADFLQNLKTRERMVQQKQGKGLDGRTYSS